MQQKRTYRNLVRADSLVPFNVIIKETDLHVLAEQDLSNITQDIVMQQRAYIETYINNFPEFSGTLSPWVLNSPAPEIIRDMSAASITTGVGPMAAVAGAVAEHVGKELLKHSDQVVIENGGDLFVKINTPVVAGIFAGESPLSMRVGIRIDRAGEPLAICTSSGKIGHSISLGKADAVCIASTSCTLADAAATAIANSVLTSSDIQKAIDFGKDIKGVDGIVIIIDDKMGMWGSIEVVPF